MFKNMVTVTKQNIYLPGDIVDKSAVKTYTLQTFYDNQISALSNSELDNDQLHFPTYQATAISVELILILYFAMANIFMANNCMTNGGVSVAQW